MLKVPTSLVLGLGEWGTAVTQTLAQSLFSTWPHLRGIVRPVSLCADDEGLSVRTWPWQAPAFPCPDDRTAWQLLRENAQIICATLRSELEHASDPRQDLILREGGLSRLVGSEPEGALQFDTLLIADWAEPGAGLWACEMAGALRQIVPQHGPYCGYLQVGLAAIDATGRAGDELSASGEASRLARAWLRLAETDRLSVLCGDQADVPEDAVVLVPASASARAPTSGGGLFDLLLYLDDANILGQCFPPLWLTSFAAEVARFYLVAHADLSEGHPDGFGLLTPPSQPHAPGPAYYGSVGVSTLYYPLPELLAYGAARAAMVSMRECALRPAEQLGAEGTERARAKFRALWQSHAVGLEPATFLDSLEKRIAIAEDGKPIQPPTGWEVATDRSQMERWPEEISNYELVLLSKLRRSSEAIEEKARRLMDELSRALRSLGDSTLADASAGLAQWETTLEQALILLQRFRKQLAQQARLLPPDTEAPRQRLAEAIANLPQPLAIAVRLALLGVPLSVFLPSALVHLLSCPPPLASWLGLAGGIGLPFLGMLAFWSLRWHALRVSRERALEAVRRKAAAAVRELVRQQVEPLLGHIEATIAQERDYSRRLREALSDAEYMLWHETALPQIGAHVAWETLAAQYAPDGSDADRWRGSRVLSEFAQWRQERPQPELPVWLREGGLVSTVSPTEFEARICDLLGLYRDVGRACEVWQELINHVQPYRGWRSALDAGKDDWAADLSQRLVQYFISDAPAFAELRRKNVDDSATDLPPEDLRRLWHETLLPRSSPFTRIAADQAPYEVMQPADCKIVACPSLVAPSHYGSGGTEACPLAPLARDADFGTFIPSHSPLHAFVVRGFTGVSLDLLQTLRGPLVTSVRALLDRPEGLAEVAIPERHALVAEALEALREE